jgi:hypothetical protein
MKLCRILNPRQVPRPQCYNVLTSSGAIAQNVMGVDHREVSSRKNETTACRMISLSSQII